MGHMMINQNSNRILVGAIEGGGTKFNCVTGYGNGDIVAKQTFPTTSPEETLSRVAHFFQVGGSVYNSIKALAIAQFGPLETDRAAKKYGRVLTTVKAGWSDFDIVGFFSKILDVPIAFQTDVNGAAIGEYFLGAAQGNDNFVYVTVGTGIGGGVFVNGRLLNDKKHPEIGHMSVQHDLQKDDFPGCCPFHGNCLEGLASGPAIRKRWGLSGEELVPNHPAWQLEAHYLARLCVNLTCCHAPEKIIFGGGVMQQKQIFPALHKEFLTLMAGYMPALNDRTVARYIVPAALGGDAATRGGLIMAQQLYARRNEPPISAGTGP